MKDDKLKFLLQLAVAYFAFAVTVNPAIAQPILVGANSAGETYADPKDIRIESWGFTFIAINNVKAGSAHSAGRPVGSIEISYSVKCVERVQKLERAISFSDPWAKGTVLTTAAPPNEWEPIAKGSVVDALHVAFCK